MQRRRQRWSVLRVLLFVVPGLAGAALAANADAFTVSGRSDGRDIRYFMDEGNIVAELGSGAPAAIRAGDFAWEAHDLEDWAQFTHDNSLGAPRLVFAGEIDGLGDGVFNTYAYARPVGCAYNATCEMKFDTAENWYRDAGTPTPAGQVDLRAVAAHEFGHWVGMDHSGGTAQCVAPDLLASDNNAEPTMMACGATDRHRDPKQDDINGFHVARQASRLPTANDSFEYTASTYGWKYVPRGGGGVSRICDGTSYHKSCRLQDTGVNTSFFQDIVSRGAELSSKNLYARAWLRSSSGASITATVAVWNLSADPDVVIRSKQCTIGTSWSECKTGTFTHSSGTRLRVEVYNNTGTHLNHDLVSLRW